MASARHNRPQFYLSDTLALQTNGAVAELVPGSNSRPFRVLGIDCKLVSASAPVGTALLTGNLALTGIASLAAAVLGATDAGKVIASGALPSLPVTMPTGAQSVTVGTPLISGTAVVQFVTWGYFVG